MIYRDILKCLEIETEELVGSIEHTLTHILHLEIWLGLLLIERILSLSHSLCIISPVPRLDNRTCRKNTCLDILVHDRLHVNDLLLSLSHSRSHDAGEEYIHSLRCTRHLVGEDHLCRIVISQKGSLLDTKSHHLHDEVLVVILIAVVATGSISLEHLLPQRTVLGHSHSAGILGNRNAELLCKSIVLGKQTVSESVGKRRKLHVDLTHACLLSLTESDTVLHECIIEFLESHLLLLIESEILHIFIKNLNLCKEVRIHEDVVTMHRHERKSLLNDLLERLGSIRLGNIEKHIGHTVKHRARTLVSLDYILECRSILIGDDGINLLLLLTDSVLDCRNVMLLLNLCKVRNAVRGVPFCQERVRIVT